MTSRNIYVKHVEVHVLRIHAIVKSIVVHIFPNNVKHCLKNCTLEVGS